MIASRCPWRAIDGYRCVRDEGHGGEHTVYADHALSRPVCNCTPIPSPPPAPLPAGGGWFFMTAGLAAALEGLR